VDVTHQRQQVTVVLHQKRFVPFLKQMPHPLMAPIEPLRIGGLKCEHDAREHDRSSLEGEMYVVVHEALGDDTEAIPRATGSEPCEIRLAVHIITEDRLPLVPTSGDVVDPAGNLDP
jgi:hypothetical protein